MSPVGRLVITGGVVVPGDGRVLPDATVVVQGARILEIREDGGRPEPAPSDWRVDAGGRLVTAGPVDAFLALPDEPERAAAVLIETLLSGTTAAVARVAPEVAFEIAEYANRLGLRLLLALEADRPGPDDAFAAARRIEERRRLWPDRVRVGLALRQTSDPARLEEVLAEARASGWPVLLPAAADQGELGGIYGRFGRRPVERLQEAGALGPGTVVTGHVLDSTELARLAESRTPLVACPRAAWRRNVVPPLDRALEAGALAALGTCAEGPGIVAEAVLTHVLTRGTSAGEPGVLAESFAGGGRILSQLLDLPLGRLEAGALADVVVHGWRPSRPVRGAWFLDLPWGCTAAWVVVGGEVVLREGRPLGADLAAVARRARERGRP